MYEFNKNRFYNFVIKSLENEKKFEKKQLFILKRTALYDNEKIRGLNKIRSFCKFFRATPRALRRINSARQLCTSSVLGVQTDTTLDVNSFILT